MFNHFTLITLKSLLLFKVHSKPFFSVNLCFGGLYPGIWLLWTKSCVVPNFKIVWERIVSVLLMICKSYMKFKILHP